MMSDRLMKNIYIVDDHPLIRRGYAYLIDREPDLSLCGEAASAAKALEDVPRLKPDLLITDVSLDDMNGIELVKQLQALKPDLPILVVSVHDEMLYAERALASGARGYVTKSRMEEAVVNAIRSLLNGNFFFSEKVNNRIFLQCQGKTGTTTSTPLTQLTDRELDVFEKYGRGLSTRQIAESLNISPKTVETHRGRIKEKMAYSNSTEMLKHAVHWVQEQCH